MKIKFFVLMLCLLIVGCSQVKKPQEQPSNLKAISNLKAVFDFGYDISFSCPNYGGGGSNEMHTFNQNLYFLTFCNPHNGEIFNISFFEINMSNMKSKKINNFDHITTGEYGSLEVKNNTLRIVDSTQSLIPTQTITELLGDDLPMTYHYGYVGKYRFGELLITVGYKKITAKNIQSNKTVWEYGIVSIGESLLKEGILYFSDYDHILYALNASTGKDIWKYNQHDDMPLILSIKGSAIYFVKDVGGWSGTPHGCQIIQLNSRTGDFQNIAGNCSSKNNVIIQNDTIININTDNIRAFKIPRLGTQYSSLWNFNFSKGYFNYILSDNTLYFYGTPYNFNNSIYNFNNSIIYALNIENGELIWSYTLNETLIHVSIEQALVIPGNSINFLTSSKKIYSFRTS